MFPCQQLPLSRRIIKASPVYRHRDVAPLSSYRGPYRNWDQTSMLNAIEAVRRGQSVRRAAELYNVPRSTLSDKVLGKVPLEARSGPPTYLTTEEEEELTSYLLQMAKIGYAHTRMQVIALVQQVVDSKGIATVVSSGWWDRYVKRHPQLSLRVAVPLSMARAMASDSEVIDRYFDMLEDCLRSNGILNKQACIFNCDETGVPLNPKSLKVVDKVGSKNPSYLTGGCKTQITVMACTCAAGYAIPPLVIFDRMTLNEAMTKGEVPGTVYGLSHNGWITREIFQEWFKHFLMSIPSVRPVILLLDGHSAHYCPETIRMAAEKQVILCALPPHTTHLTQPLDVGCFAPLKVAWRDICHKFCTSNPGRSVSRYDFCGLFAKAWFKAFNMPNIIRSFEATGVCPFNRRSIPLPDNDNSFSTFKPSSLPERTGLAYIPLYSPAHPPHPSIVDVSSEDETQLSARIPHSTPVKMSCISSSLSFSTPLSYSEPSLLDESLFSSRSQPLPFVTPISKFLHQPIPPSKIPTKKGKSAGQVLTSRENLQLLQEREKQKQAAILEKEQKKRMREEKAKKKNEKINSTKGKPRTYPEPETEQTFEQQLGNESGADCSQLPESPVVVPTKKAKRSLVRDSKSSSKKLQLTNPRSVCARGQQKKAPSKETGGDSSLQLPESPVVVPTEKGKRSLVRDSKSSSKKLQVTNPQSVRTRGQQKKAPSKETGGDSSLQLPESPVVVPTEKAKRSLVRDSKSSIKLQVTNPQSVSTRGQQKKAPNKETRELQVTNPRSVCTRGQQKKAPSKETGGDSSLHLPESPVVVPTEKGKRSFVRGSKSSNKLQVTNPWSVRTRGQQKKAPRKETEGLQVINPRSVCTRGQQNKAPSKETGDGEVRLRRVRFLEDDSISPLPDPDPETEQTFDQELSNESGGDCSQLPESPMVVPTEKGKRSLVRESKKQRALTKEAGGVNSCVQVVSDSDPDPEWWIKVLELYEDDKEILLSDTEYLNGNIINASQTLMSLQFPHISGFQDTGLALKLNFQPVDQSTSSVQILHRGDTNHWICTCSTKGSSAVMVLDSLALFMGLSVSTVLQISKIYKVSHKKSTIDVHKLSVQQQKGVHDCGLFSVAYAMEICLGRNPQCAHFDQSKMRNHLFECLCEGTMTAFPKLSPHDSEALPRPSPVIKHIKVYCICRLPEEYDDMVCCDGCNRWYHITCMKLRNKNLQAKQWKCHECS